MTPPPGSLTARLLLAAICWLTLGLGVTGVLLTARFREHIERRFDAELNDHLEELVAAADLSPGGELFFTWYPVDPRFNRPNSGWYWQVSSGERVIASSPSLLSARLAPPRSAALEWLDAMGPDGGELRLLQRSIHYPRTDQRFWFVISGPRAELTAEVSNLVSLLVATLVTMLVLLVITVAVQIRYGLRPVRRLQQALGEITAGNRQRLPTDFPSELSGVATEINALLDYTTALVERARSQAGDLAHALKNPLAIIRNQSSGDKPDPALLDHQLGVIAATIDHQLARARMAGTPHLLAARSEVAPVVEDLLFSLERLHHQKEPHFSTSGLERLWFRGDSRIWRRFWGICWITPASGRSAR